MAGGIDWFRWHHGSVNDPKFGLVAKKVGASVAEVVAVWACFLEAASSAEERGTVGAQDFESIDFALGMEEGKAERIYSSMQDRGLIDQYGQIAAWNKRQPKREREDDGATERKRRQREREREEAEYNLAQVGCDDSVTPCHATSRQKTPRGEESREEVNNLSVATDIGVQDAPAKKPRAPSFDGQAWLVDRFVAPQVAADWLTLRKGKKSPPTETAFRQVEAEAAKAGMSLGDAVAMCCLRGWAGFRADWARQHQGAPPSRPLNLTETRAATIAALTRTTSHERTYATERDITGESSRVT